MRINVYAEEMTQRVEIVEKNGHHGVRVYLELPATFVTDRNSGGFKRPATANDPEDKLQQFKGPFIHHQGDDDSAAVTFWGKRDLRKVLRIALEKLDAYYGAREAITKACLGTPELKAKTDEIVAEVLKKINLSTAAEPQE